MAADSEKGIVDAEEAEGETVLTPAVTRAVL